MLDEKLNHVLSELAQIQNYAAVIWQNPLSPLLNKVSSVVLKTSNP